MLPRLPVLTGLITLLVAFGMQEAMPRTAGAEDAAVRSTEHQQFAEDFWNYLSDRLPEWQTVEAIPASAPTPEAGSEGVISLNSIASRDPSKLNFGSIVVVQHQRDGNPFATSVLYRSRPGVNPKRDDWYELYYLADGTLVKSSGDHASFNRVGFFTKLIDGRLWVLSLDSPDVAKLVHGEGPEKHITLPGAGPDRKTLKSDSRETAIGYLFTKPGFVTRFEDGRAWVFAQGSDAANALPEKGFPEKHVTRIGAGPLRTTIKAPDAGTIDSFLGVPKQ
ncbi:hypothetical protein [Bremerella cremea]|uniref:hypothetical protein n=1 Tax=Bremerella cremea TaxID=1031537 RepID=UPI0031E8C60D